MTEPLLALNKKRWGNVAVNKNFEPMLEAVAGRLVAAKSRYQKVEALTGVPWPLIAVIHEREASQDWYANLAQGDPWDEVSTHVPRGQGPFKSWEEAAVNAIKSETIGKRSDWSIEGSLTALELYNGLGYYRMGRSSPYVWSKTNQYIQGKFFADGKYDSYIVDKQAGCAALLIKMGEIDYSIDRQYKWGLPNQPKEVTKVTAAKDSMKDTLVNLVSTVADAVKSYLNKVEPPKIETVATPKSLPWRLLNAMHRLGYEVAEGDGVFNIIYVEGMDFNGTPNGNKPNQFNDRRILLQCKEGVPSIVGNWDATTEPGRYWTVNPMNPKGAARIKFGRYESWTVGEYHGHQVLRQVTPLTVCRDLNKDYSRRGDLEDTGLFGIHQHWGYNLDVSDLGRSSAGCLVGRSTTGHLEFMGYVRNDRRYKAAPDTFRFPTVIMPVSEVY